MYHLSEVHGFEIPELQPLSGVRLVDFFMALENWRTWESHALKGDAFERLFCETVHQGCRDITRSMGGMETAVLTMEDIIRVAKTEQRVELKFIPLSEHDATGDPLGDAITQGVAAKFGEQVSLLDPSVDMAAGFKQMRCNVLLSDICNCIAVMDVGAITSYVDALASGIKGYADVRAFKEYGTGFMEAVNKLGTVTHDIPLNTFLRIRADEERARFMACIRAAFPDAESQEQQSKFKDFLLQIAGGDETSQLYKNACDYKPTYLTGRNTSSSPTNAGAVSSYSLH